MVNDSVLLSAVSEKLECLLEMILHIESQQKLASRRTTDVYICLYCISW